MSARKSRPRVFVHAHHESCVENPLGPDRGYHRMWTLPDGAWILVREYDDGLVRIQASRGLPVWTADLEGVTHVHVGEARVGELHV